MRLTCPNCGAQYEVPDDVIPADGRDVQCSNCGTTWFQAHPDHADDLSEPERGAATATQVAEPDHDDDAEDLPDQAPVPPATRRGVAPDVADILKEEAEHEARLRERERASLETQPDLGLDDTGDDAERRARQARDRMERLRGPAQPDLTDEAIAAAASAASSSRRDRLPDIDEINSSLRADHAPARVEGGPRTEHIQDEPRKSGFARGFAIPLLIVALLVLLYAAAPQIAEAVPALDPVLNSYVLLIDRLRLWLDTQIGAFMP